MRLIHTADWHLGQTFYEFDRSAEHRLFIDWLLQQLSVCKPDALLIAGDVFDSPNPSAEAQRLFFSFIERAHTGNPQLQIVITAGNHDSAARLEAPQPLLEQLNVEVRGIVPHLDNGDIDVHKLIIQLKAGGYCLAVPYLRQGDYPKAASYAEGVSKLYCSLLDAVPDDGKPIVAMGHMCVIGSQINEGDRWEHVSLVGGVENVPAEVFDRRISYTALGHLHRYQTVGGRFNVCYSGTPLAMSFAEQSNRQGIVMVDIDDAGNVSTQHIINDGAVRLLSVPKHPAPIDEVLQAIAQLPDGEPDSTSPYIMVQVAVTQPEPSLRSQIEEAVRGKAVRLTRMTATTVQSNVDKATGIKPCTNLSDIDMLGLLQDIWRKNNGGNDMSVELEQLLNQSINTINL